MTLRVPTVLLGFLNVLLWFLRVIGLFRLPRSKWVGLQFHCIHIILMSLQLALTVYDVYGPRKAIPVGGTVVSVFGKHG